MRYILRVCFMVCVWALVSGSMAWSQTVSGYVWEDLNGDGIRDVGEPALSNVLVRMMGRDRCSGSCTSPPAYEYPSATTNTNGFFSFTVNTGYYSGGRGNYILDVSGLGADWRPSVPRLDPPPTELNKATTLPFGIYQRWSEDEFLYDQLLNPAGVDYVSLGDSIAEGKSYCFSNDSDFITDIGDRLKFINPNSVTDNRAVSGERTEDLLIDDTGIGADQNDVYYAVQQQPDLITISMIGNNFLDNQPGGFDRDKSALPQRNKSCYATQPACTGQNETWDQLVDRVLEVLLMSRQDLQEVLSTLVSRTSADVVLDTLYENEAGRWYTGSFLFPCSSSQNLCEISDLHKMVAPLVNKILRDLAWGQERIVHTAEIQPDYHHQPTVKFEDTLGNPVNVPCVGFPDIICCADNTHPSDEGAQVHEQRSIEALGMVCFGQDGTGGGDTGEYGDQGGRTTHTDVNYGYLHRVAVIYPTQYQVLNTATVTNPTAAYVPDGTAASVAINSWDPASPGTFVVSGFQLPPNVQPTKVLVKVRYRTTAPPADEYYRFEASTVSFVRPSLLNATNFNYFTPIVGTHGKLGFGYSGDEGAIAVPVLAYPDQPTFRTASASLFSQGAILVTDPTDDRYVHYEWPPLTASDISSLKVRLQGAVREGFSVTPGESYNVEVDGVWLEVYGQVTATSPPGEPASGSLAPLTLQKNGTNLDFSWGSVPGTCGGNDYALYQGNISSLPTYDHAAVTCTTSGNTTYSMAIPSATDAYFLVTALTASEEGSYGRDSGGSERAPAASPCKTTSNLSVC